MDFIAAKQSEFSDEHQRGLLDGQLMAPNMLMVDLEMVKGTLARIVVVTVLVKFKQAFGPWPISFCGWF